MVARGTRNGRNGAGAGAAGAGFTLIELLVVMVVIAILGMIIMGGAGYLNRIVRERRAKTTGIVLETALARYHADYNKWPIGLHKPDSNYRVRISGEANKDIFVALREKNKDNPLKNRYLDETTLFTVGSDGQPMRLNKAAGARPLIYVTREGAKVRYFSVEINVDTDTVKVSAPELYD